MYIIRYLLALIPGTIFIYPPTGYLFISCGCKSPIHRLLNGMTFDYQLHIDNYVHKGKIGNNKISSFKTLRYIGRL